jgi:hypothetical protein
VVYFDTGAEFNHSILNQILVCSLTWCLYVQNTTTDNYALRVFMNNKILKFRIKHHQWMNNDNPLNLELVLWVPSLGEDAYGCRLFGREKWENVVDEGTRRYWFCQPLELNESVYCRILSSATFSKEFCHISKEFFVLIELSF